MRIVFIGCVHFSYITLQHVLTLNNVEVVGIVTRKDSKFNSDFCSLEAIATKLCLPCFFVNENNQEELVGWLTKLHPDTIYCFGWSFLLGQQILQIPKLGVIGYHPAALPKNRGRHPIIWSLALGLVETASTFFFMDEGADSGDIIDQQRVAIAVDDNAHTLYEKLIVVSLRQITNFTSDLVKGRVLTTPQDHSKANYWRKRTKADGLIDWRMSSESIYNLVRALSYPYVGAYCIYKTQEIKIWEAKILQIGYQGGENIEPGKILSTQDGEIAVKSGNGRLLLIEHWFETLPKVGDYL